ncbi:MAG TPA: ScpA family protein [Candidatus Nanoarchaeia archaeon]|nr:ScpA family protein [Candidatus Nanoarchaeia archaeon]
MQQQIFELLLGQEDVSWKSILQELVKKEEMDPWDIDITNLSQKYIQIIKEMQEHDFRISGKILLAAAFLLKMKSAYLVDHDIAHLDLLIGQTDGADENEIFEELENGEKRVREQFSLIPRNPQPRTRKVSLQELIDALQRAMQSRKRILAQQRPVKFVIPTRKMDILGVIRDLYHKISYYAVKENTDTLTFSKLLPPRAGRQEKVYTFIPLLHLEHQEKVETTQEKPFEEIYVKLLKKNTGKTTE